jgi:endonuclease YncB( thermonuclease family)
VKSILLGALAVLAAALIPASAQSGLPRVIDGDTIDVGGQRVRLWGIDAPESRQQCDRNGQAYACGHAATEYLRDLVGDGWVDCEPRTHDRYGRVVARCFVRGEDMGAAMVRAGWAMAFVRYSRDYVGDERQARAARSGMWAGSFQPPWEWRARHR